jgi:hypothetical protein
VTKTYRRIEGQEPGLWASKERIHAYGRTGTGVVASKDRIEDYGRTETGVANYQCETVTLISAADLSS